MSIASPPQRPTPPRPGAAPGRPPHSGGSGGFTATIDPIRVIRRHMFWLFASVFVGGILGVAAFVLLDRHYPIYSAEVLFEIRASVERSTDIGAGDIGSDDLVARLANTEAVMLTNREVLRRAVRHPRVQQETVWAKKYMVVGEGGHETFDIESALDDLQSELTASLVRGTNFFRLQWRTQQAADLPVVLNLIADEYLAQRRDAAERAWRDNQRLFSEQLEQTTQQLDILERDIQEFIVEAGMTTLVDTRHSQIAYAAEQLARQIAMARSNLSVTESSLMQTAAKFIGTIEPSAADLREAKADPAVHYFDQRLAALRAERGRQHDTFIGNHPALPRIEADIRALEREREAKVDEVVQQNLEARHKILQDEVEQIRTLLAELESEADAKDEALRELTASTSRYHGYELQRRRLETQRETELQMIQELQLIQARDDARRVHDAQRAERPRQKSFPRWPIVIPLVTLMSLGLTLAFIFLRELTDQRIKSASDLSVIHGAKVLGVIPDLDDDPVKSKRAELVVRNHPNSVLAESYRQVCALLTRSIERHGHQTILLLGGLPGAGTTTAVTNIGVSLAATGRSVLVIDANFRRSRLAAAIGVADEHPGLGDLLVGQCSVEDALQPSEVGVSVISAGTPANRVFERLNNGLFESIVAELRGQFDVILFDAPPAVVAGDAMVLANRVDAALLVARANQEQRGLVARILHQLSDARCEPLGILLNRPRGTAGGYFKKNFEAMAKYSGGSR